MLCSTLGWLACFICMGSVAPARNNLEGKRGRASPLARGCRLLLVQGGTLAKDVAICPQAVAKPSVLDGARGAMRVGCLSLAYDCRQSDNYVPSATSLFFRKH